MPKLINQACFFLIIPTLMCVQPCTTPPLPPPLLLSQVWDPARSWVVSGMNLCCSLNNGLLPTSDFARRPPALHSAAKAQDSACTPSNRGLPPESRLALPGCHSHPGFSRTWDRQATDLLWAHGGLDGRGQLLTSPLQKSILVQETSHRLCWPVVPRGAQLSARVWQSFV